MVAGNSQRRGAIRGDGKKGATVGSGGQRRRALEGRGPTPKAEERPHHPAARRRRQAERDATSSKRSEKAAPPGRGRPDRKASSGESVIIGRNAVLEALRAQIPARALWVQAKADADERWREALRLASHQRVEIVEAPKGEVDALAQDGVHQGLVLVLPEFDYSDVSDLESGSLLVALDSITDSRNLGAIVRSAYAFGADGVILGERRSARVTAGSWKASAGALAHVKVAQVTNVTRSLRRLADAGWTIVGLAAEGESTVDDLPPAVLQDRVVIVIGAEGAGLSRLVKEACDWRVRIAMAPGAESLNAAVAAGIMLHAAFTDRQRAVGGSTARP